MDISKLEVGSWYSGWLLDNEVAILFYIQSPEWQMVVAMNKILEQTP